MEPVSKPAAPTVKPAARSAPGRPTSANARPGMPTAPAASNLRIQVGRLTLDGFNLPAGGEQLVQAAFETELARLFSEQPLPALLRSGGARRDLPGGALSISNWMDPADLGRQIARTLYKGMQL
jgi:hypothetical protein